MNRVVQPAKETRTGHEELGNAMQTLPRGIANKAAQDQAYRFRNLISLLTIEFLLRCWQSVKKKAATGVDRITAHEYAQNLESNVETLVRSVKGGWYRAKLVLRKYLPKLNRKLRPLGIPAIADKLLQTAGQRRYSKRFTSRIFSRAVTGTGRAQVRTRRSRTYRRYCGAVAIITLSKRTFKAFSITSPIPNC